MKKRLYLLLVAFALCLPATVFGQATGSIPPMHPSLYRGVRPLGMGNAFLTMPGSDENAMYYNPAAINDYEKFHLRLISPVIDFTTSSISLVKDILDLVDDIDNNSGNTSAQINTFETFVDAHTGEFHSLNAEIPVLMMMNKWFSVGIIADSRTTISFRNRTFSNFEVLSRSDLGGEIGTAYGVPVKDGKIQGGVAVKVLHRVSIDQVLTTDDILANTSDFANAMPIDRATGVGFDLGLKGEVPTFDLKALQILKPTVGLTWQDVGNTRFSNPVPDTEQSISLGVGVHPKFEFLKRDWENHFLVDIREINQPLSFSKKLYMGYELMFPKLAFFRPSIRVGANQLYITGGLTLDLHIFKLEFATYGEETGRYTRQGQSRRVATNISFGF